MKPGTVFTLLTRETDEDIDEITMEEQEKILQNCYEDITTAYIVPPTNIYMILIPNQISILHWHLDQNLAHSSTRLYERYDLRYTFIVGQFFPPGEPKKTPSQLKREAREKLLALVDTALTTIENAMKTGDSDDAVSVKAAFGVLDRAGFGVHSSIDITDKRDYSKLSHTELLERLNLVREKIAIAQGKTQDKISTIHWQHSRCPKT